MLPSTSSELPSSAAPLDREPEPSSLQVPSCHNPPNSDDDDDGDDHVRLTRQRTGAEASGHHFRGRSLDVPVPPAPTPSSSCSRPKTDASPAPAAAAVAAVEGILPVPFRLSLTLRNNGSVARDHLASERTFLAYVRTSLSFASAGVGPSLSSPLLSVFRLSSFLKSCICVRIRCV
jgi:hypothetical protein